MSDDTDGDDDRQQPEIDPWKDETESFPIAINIYDGDEEKMEQYYTVVIRDESFDDGYIISDVVDMLAPNAEREGIYYDEDDSEKSGE